jgi:hypothetical protein
MTTSKLLSATVILSTYLALAGCGGETSSEVADGGPAGRTGNASGAAGSPGADAASSQHLTFVKDGAPVSVDFSKWGTPAYYQETAAGWTLAVVANEVAGDQGRYFSLMLRATDGGQLALGTYPCAPAADGPKVLGQITWAEANMARVWKQAADAPCSIAIDDIGPVGGRLQGRFSATLKAAKGGGPDVVVADGAFDVDRKEY